MATGDEKSAADGLLPELGSEQKSEKPSDAAGDRAPAAATSSPRRRSSVNFGQVFTREFASDAAGSRWNPSGVGGADGAQDQESPISGIAHAPPPSSPSGRISEPGARNFVPVPPRSSQGKVQGGRRVRGSFLVSGFTPGPLQSPAPPVRNSSPGGTLGGVLSPGSDQIHGAGDKTLTESTADGALHVASKRIVLQPADEGRGDASRRSARGGLRNSAGGIIAEEPGEPVAGNEEQGHSDASPAQHAAPPPSAAEVQRETQELFDANASYLREKVQVVLEPCLRMLLRDKPTIVATYVKEFLVEVLQSCYSRLFRKTSREVLEVRDVRGVIQGGVPKGR